MNNLQINLPQLHIELWPGYITSIRQHEKDILLGCEISHKVMRQETLYDILRNCREKQQGEGFKEAFCREVLGTVVLTDYNNRTYRIDDVDWNVNPSCTFDANGVQKTFIQYYKEKYNIQIRDPRQPLLVSNPKARDIRGDRPASFCLVPELCRSTGLTDSMRSNFHTMKALSEFTRMDPEKRIKSLTDFSRRLINTPESSETLTKFNVQLNPNMVEITGRKLRQEAIIFGNGKTYTSDDKADWTPALRNNLMYQNEQLTRWGIIYPQRAINESKELSRLLIEVSTPLGFNMSAPKEIVLPDDRNMTYSKATEDFVGKDPSFIMIILPNNSADRYKTVKNITCVNRKIPTQVVVQRTIQPKKGSMSGLKSIATKIAIQMSCKLGGAPWSIAMPLSGTMVCGFDVSRDTTDKTKSYGALVASMDLKKCVKFWSSIAHHRNGEECSNNIEIQMKKALIAFRDEHGVFPDKILFYRDGVGDGEIPYVYDVEVKKLRKLFEQMYEATGQVPKFAFVIVSKRVNARFFEKSGNRYQNPPPGTVIDDIVTLPERYDFYLVSQSVRQGTVSPTSYNIIYDTLGLPPDRMQMLTYKMCHLYYNWCGTTRFEFRLINLFL
jgi:aubergine